MAPPPLPLFSPSPKQPPPPPWLHGPKTPATVSPSQPVEAPPSSKPPQRQRETSTSTNPLSAGVPGGRTRRAVLGIIRRVRSLELSDPPSPKPIHSTRSAVPLFHLPIEECRGEEAGGDGNGRPAPWSAARDEGLKAALRRQKKARQPTPAERLLDPAELDRLRRAARGTGDGWLRAKKAGVTDEVVEDVCRVWSGGQELAAVRVVEPLRRCMDRAREILEIKSGGLVVWTKGDVHFVYRGSSYLENIKHRQKSIADIQRVPLEKCTAPGPQWKHESNAEPSTNHNDDAHGVFRGIDPSLAVHAYEEPVEGTLYEREVNRLLDSLGPRFVDWWWNTPLPVDADLLPEVVPGFKTPFRQCPPGVRPTLADEELTYLRKLARPLPTHFALGRNTRLQGLAAAVLKLWEKSLIAKIAVKVGIQNTNNEQMAWNLKHLTGGTIILRNKDFVILYRGKDFLPGGVKQSVIEQEARVYAQQVKEEEARLMVMDSLKMFAGLPSEESSVGSFREYQDFQLNHVQETTENNMALIELEAEKHRLEKELKDQERRLFILTKKIERSNEALAKLHNSWNPSEQSADKELLTEEERMIFRKIGLKMDEHVLLGRRGIFDGVIEEIHQHWKHKEIVKVITKQNQAYQITYTSMLLEVETGGMLIATQKLTNSHAIILYRGKNYHRPTKSSPSNLLTKREALRRSVEVQRRGSMKYYVWERHKSIEDLQWRLANVITKIRKLTV
ncbi:chloroplastic group IIA intron splicing facilitator CRS1, chloroplastic-like [Hordeum vulgare subsp. vulgare]|uniref:chloroplastic group IIA intron splicing facilitator CRS1, chloroplastic-like n=1 Tax=Hordeum vulgare subsp. vulgare TaxID=112509 RepID=UPI00162C2977|nr:chloroplastic group IIA intron splicing facilitator CRS1, chloroplastic-like [Hordeum vulgare subsp. vulgare]